MRAWTLNRPVIIKDNKELGKSQLRERLGKEKYLSKEKER